MPITSSLHWDVYKEKVSQSEDKSLELFATKVEAPRFSIDLNRLVSSPMTERRSVPFVDNRIVIDASNAYSQPPTSQENEVDLYGPNACSQPPTSQANEVDVIATEKIIQEDGDVGDDDVDLDEVEEGFHGIDVGNFDAYIAQKDMDRELPFRRLYGYDSDDEGPQEELDEDGFTKEETQIHFELTGLEKITHVFRDLSLSHKVVVDGGMRSTSIEPTPCPDPREPRDEDEDENDYFKKGVKFLTLDDMMVWLSDYAFRNHMSFYVEHSDINLRFTVKCEKGDEGCPWNVSARKLGETREWVLRSCVPTHLCKPPKKCDRTTHRQLTCEYLGYKIMKDMGVDPTVKVRACKSKELSKYLTHVCVAFTTQAFDARYTKLFAAVNYGGKEFLTRNFSEKHKWARAHDGGRRRYGDMTSNLVQCFNNILKGDRSLPVIAIVEYIFFKLNEYFQSHSEETTKWIGEKMDYPTKVDEWLQLQATKSSQQQIITFDINEMKYQVDEPGGKTRDGNSYGGAAFEVHLKTRWCQCERPNKYHCPCSHLITAAKAAHIAVCDGKTMRMQEFHVEATRLTWAPRFHPFLDQSQWPQYHGTHIKPDPLFMVETKGRRRTKRFRGDMDDLSRYTGMNQFGSGHFMEDPDTNNYGVCDEGRHNTRTCKKRKTSNGGIPSSRSRHMTSRRRGSDGGGRKEAQVLEVVLVDVEEAQVLEVVVVVV
ncbi:hypothetical protein D1007_13642 [Hordeum vulgare]|nr:hypothetical protein D1007_13642 [Hordeum vulgare]